MTDRLAVFGDSIAAGLGVRGQRYMDIIAEQLGMELVDCSSSAQTVTDSLARLDEVGAAVQIALVAHGTTEAILRPSARALRFMPARWRRTGWMDPRPYYSTNRRRRTFEQAESGIRWRVKVALLRIGQRTQLVPLPRYRADLLQLISELELRGARVVLVGVTDLDNRYFPGSGAAVREFEATAAQLGPAVVRMADRLDRWSDFCADHFHPNDAGHRVMANVIVEALG